MYTFAFASFLYLYCMKLDDHEVFCSAFRKLVISIRRDSLVTQRQLSKISGLTRQFISMLECGKRIPSFETFCALAMGLDMTPVELLERFSAIYEAEYMAKNRRLRERSKAAEYIRNTSGRNLLES